MKFGQRNPDTSNFWLVVGLIALAVLSRWLPHTPNFTPLLAVGLLAGSRIRSRLHAFAVPFAAMMISDLALGWHSTLPFVYLGLAATVALGLWTLKSRENFALRFLGSSVLAASIFFVVSNFGVWFMQGLYPKDFNGLQACFVAAIPFFSASLGSTLAYGIALFGLSYLIESKWSLADRSAPKIG